MKTSRRNFLQSTAALTVGATLIPAWALGSNKVLPQSMAEQFDPWIEVFPEAIRYNAKVLHRLSGNRPVLAVIKNNGYGLGDVNVAKILDDTPEMQVLQE